jgi:hypothetical protein
MNVAADVGLKRFSIDAKGLVPLDSAMQVDAPDEEQKRT